ncbi:SMP-30/gluconolactonase/LRE family protein [Kitasatospora sp. NPDC096147]|uniref:SMP-30/gluconolactonase/LRE family protein n=1 Tax=Kitasatospora sp. NPDC096147 TaxID=3364093 RepID=UPI003813DC4C
MPENLSRRTLFGLGAAVGAGALLGLPAGPASAADSTGEGWGPDWPTGSTAPGADDPGRSGAARPSGHWPDRFALPNGFRPEGIAIDDRGRAYFGSLADGRVLRYELATGRGELLYPGPAAGTPSLGMKADGRGRLFTAGAWGGDARVLDTRSGEVLASYQLSTDLANTFVNDVVLTRDVVWITESLKPVLYGLPLGPGGRLPRPDQVIRRQLTGDVDHVPDEINANGIETTPDGRALLVVNMTTGALQRIDPATGRTAKVDLGGQSLPFGDGLLRRGRDLYVVRNQADEVTVVRLDPAGRRGTVTRRITDPRFRVPATVAAHGDRLYLPNARFGTEPTPDTDYDVVAVRLH